MTTSQTAPFDPRYIEARRTLLDALTALAPHSTAVIVAGAQAIYLRAGNVIATVAPYTTDGDLALDPAHLEDDPELERAMESVNLTLLVKSDGNIEQGIWVGSVHVNGEDIPVQVDLLVPKSLSNTKSRGARLGTHGKRAARLVPGIEAILVDHSPLTIGSLDPNDPRSVVAEVAGPASLFIAKAHKIHDRVEEGRDARLKDKDASDVIRLMQAFPPDDVASVMADLKEHPISGDCTTLGLAYLDEFFGARGREGITMATRALEFGMPSATVEALSVAYVQQLLRSI